MVGHLDFASIAKIWRAGCIIRAAFLQSITQAYERDENLNNLLLDDFFAAQLSERQLNWRKAYLRCHHVWYSKWCTFICIVILRFYA